MLMELESRIQALIAVGAAVSANCQPCLQSALKMACESGVDEREIAEAIEVGKQVRRGAASNLDKFASGLKLAIPSPIAVAGSGCECSQL
jgi:AhpD family alkylhydroperoxidase